MKKLTAKSILIILIVIWTAVIFSFSLAGGQQSHHESNSVKYILSSAAKSLDLHVNHKIYNIYKPFVEDKNHITSEDFVRKTAHFTEYFLLGVFCSAAALFLRKKSRLWFIPLFLGIPVALFDEKIIQKFLVPGRTSSLTDALLDNIGFYSAVIIVFLVCLVWKKAKNHSKRC